VGHNMSGPVSDYSMAKALTLGLSVVLRSCSANRTMIPRGN